MTDGFSFKSTNWADFLLPANGELQAKKFQGSTSSRVCRVGCSLCQVLTEMLAFF